LAGQIISRLTGEANQWMLDCLSLQGDDRVLDVGCGPGRGVALAADRATAGFVAGVDSSATMVRQASRRNRLACRDGRVHVVQADATRLPFRDAHFDKAWSLNSMQFWAAPERGLRELRRVVGRGGRTVVGLMARSGDDGEGVPPPWLAGTAGMMTDAGFGDITFERRTFGDVIHWALLSRA